jgi:hypothetical protein
MMQFEINPGIGVGPIKLGSTREVVRQEFGEPEYVHERRQVYLEGFCIDFNEKGVVEFIELSKSSKYDVVLDGLSVLSIPAEEAVQLVLKRASYDPNDPELGHSYIFPEIQLSLWRGVVPDLEDNLPDEDGLTFEAVGIAEKGYFSFFPST